MKHFTASVILFIVFSRFLPFGQSLCLASVTWLYVLLLRTIQFIQNLLKVRHIPGKKYLLTPWDTLASLLLPGIPYVNADLNLRINDSRKSRRIYEEFGGVSICSIVSAFSPRIMLRITDPVAIKAIVADRKQFPKFLETYRILAEYGENIVITEGDEWRKHRRVVGPAFSETTYDLVWSESTKVTMQWKECMTRQEDAAGSTVHDNCQTLGLQLALNVSTG